MYRRSDKKPEISVADVVLDAINTGAHRKKSQSEEEVILTTNPTVPLPAHISASHASISIADIVLDAHTYSSLREASQPDRTVPEMRQRSRSPPPPNVSKSPRTGREGVRSSPPGRRRSSSISPEVRTAPNPPLKRSRTMSGGLKLMDSIRAESKALSRKFKSWFTPASS